MNRRRPMIEPEPQPEPRGFGGIKALAIVISAVVFIGLGLMLAAITRRGAASLPPTPFPGSAFVLSGSLDQRAPGSYFTGFKAGNSVPFGPGSLVRINRGLVEMNLPGNYQLAVFGTQEAQALLELAQAAIYNQPSQNTVKLLAGGLVVRSGPEVDRRVRMAVVTDMGAATIAGTVMGVRYNPETRIMEVDCLYGSCDVEAHTAAAVRLDEGQRVTIDELGQLSSPGFANLALYSEYPLRLWVPEAALERMIAAASSATFTPTPTPEMSNETPTATPELPTWTPAPPSPTPAVQFATPTPFSTFTPEITPVTVPPPTLAPFNPVPDVPDNPPDSNPPNTNPADPTPRSPYGG